MKAHKRLQFFVIILLLTTYHLSLIALNIAPYYDFQLSQGISIPSKGGETNFTIDLINDLGIVFKPHSEHSILGFFELKYLGPGLRKQEGERFTDRYLDYLFVLRHNWNFKPTWQLKSQFDYIKENRRTAANEAWGLGLYDYNRLGGIITVEKEFRLAGDSEVKSAFSVYYHFLSFPNYTDLLKEFQAGAGEAETEAGKQNHHLVQIRTGLSYLMNKLNIAVAVQSYTKQKVITNTVQSDGSYYSSELQRDIITTISAERTQKISTRVAIVPSMTFKNRTSNQNYQHFESAGSTVPVSYQPNYYNYSQVVINLPVTYILGKKWDFVFSPEFDYKFYSSRAARNELNQFTDEKQNNFLVLLSIGFNKRTDISTTTVFYTHQRQTSNMKFEKYLPYNYDGHFFGLKYSLRY